MTHKRPTFIEPKKEERSSSDDTSHAGVESTSEDSDSTDEGIDVDGKS